MSPAALLSCPLLYLNPSRMFRLRNAHTVSHTVTIHRTQGSHHVSFYGIHSRVVGTDVSTIFKPHFLPEEGTPQRADSGSGDYASAAVRTARPLTLGIDGTFHFT